MGQLEKEYQLWGGEVDGKTECDTVQEQKKKEGQPKIGSQEELP